MNWKLIFGLSLFGLFMAIATVFFIPMNAERYMWPVIFLICAYLIAKNAPGKYFLHGLLVCLVNCVWITSAHILLSETYLANHAMELAQYDELNKKAGLTTTQAMLIMGTVIGVFSGLVLGLFSFIASRLIKK